MNFSSEQRRLALNEQQIRAERDALEDEVAKLRHTIELKGSLGEGPNHSNHSNHSNSFKIGIFGLFSLENSKISENFNIF